MPARLRLAAIALLLLAACETDTSRYAAPSASSCDVDYAALKRAEMIELAAAGQVVGRMILGELSEDDLDEQQVRTLKRMQEILDDRERPVDDFDLEILDRAEAMLSGPESWDRADDRECLPGDTTFSLYCSLFFASVDVTGLYEHRRTVTQEVRFAVEDMSAGRRFEHRLMDFNNAPQTTFEDIGSVFATARQVITARQALQADCAL
jgi:hypothetical protein